ncbi:MAG: branched-chain amino acid transporter AzlD [Actinobacteria bacterium]|nr:branched-chain amino acid transporter AzlD [Actinomycetota bacterium]MEC7810712.1 AzlD domain-containing protein [Actinomycetota bacterium]|tara:strand:+ start:1717 stop:2013 length:297 start_codon:yes stop_codon:yes gene_type:complete
MTWGAVIALSAGSYAFKLFGLIAGQRFNKHLAPATVLLPAALFSALVVIMSISDDGSLVVDARLVGVGIGALAVWKKMPFTFVVLTAMLSTAVIRLFL